MKLKEMLKYLYLGVGTAPACNIVEYLSIIVCCLFQNCKIDVNQRLFLTLIVVKYFK